jgi:hypothetical protein
MPAAQLEGETTATDMRQGEEVTGRTLQPTGKNSRSIAREPAPS